MLMCELGIGLGSKGGSTCKFWFGFGLCGSSGDEIGEFVRVGGTVALLIDKERMVVWSDACSMSWWRGEGCDVGEAELLWLRVGTGAKGGSGSTVTCEG